MKVIDVLNGLQLGPWQHVVLVTNGYVNVGGGNSADMIRRFPNWEVLRTVIQDDIVKMYVCEE